MEENNPRLSVGFRDSYSSVGVLEEPSMISEHTVAGIEDAGACGYSLSLPHLLNAAMRFVPSSMRKKVRTLLSPGE